MSHVVTHAKIVNPVINSLKNAGVVDKNIKRYKTLFYATFLSPDFLHAQKYFLGYRVQKRYSHMNSINDDSALRRIETEIRKIKRKLKKGKNVTWNLVWMTHFIIDSLEPMHQINWQFTNYEENCKLAFRHTRVESIVFKLTFQDHMDLIDIDGDIVEFLRHESGEIRNLHVEKYFPEDIDKLKEIYVEIINPKQIQLVASIWKKLLKDYSA